MESAPQPALLRCARCGIESAERSCFVIPRRFGKPPHDTRCLTCEQRRTAPSLQRGLVAMVMTTFWPLLILTGSHGGLRGVPLSAPFFAIFLWPTAIVLHELGHATAAWLLRLEIGLVSIGYGPTLVQFRVAGIPIEIHVWPLSGRVYLGSRGTTLLRTRLWLTTLMGPMVNAGFIALTTHYWSPLAPVFGRTALMLWLIVNAFLLVITLLPHRGNEFGRPYRSDGLALLEIPSRTPAQLAHYLTAAPLMRTLCRLQAGDYIGAKAQAQEVLARSPNNTWGRLMLSGCLLNLDEYATAAALLTPTLDTLSSQDPAMRAAIWSNLAVAQLLANVHETPQNPKWIQAERLSRDAYLMYPCEIEFRSARALILAVTGSAEDAIALLEYCHYETASARQRSDREIVRALAFQRLGRPADASERAATALRLHPGNANVLRTLGLSEV